MLNMTSHQGNENQNNNVILLHTHWHGYNKKRQTITNVGKDMEKLEPSYVAGGKIK